MAAAAAAAAAAAVGASGSVGTHSLLAAAQELSGGLPDAQAWLVWALFWFREGEDPQRTELMQQLLSLARLAGGPHAFASLLPPLLASLQPGASPFAHVGHLTQGLASALGLLAPPPGGVSGSGSGSRLGPHELVLQLAGCEPQVAGAVRSVLLARARLAAAASMRDGAESAGASGMAEAMHRAAECLDAWRDEGSEAWVRAAASHLKAAQVTRKATELHSRMVVLEGLWEAQHEAALRLLCLGSGGGAAAAAAEEGGAGGGTSAPVPNVELVAAAAAAALEATGGDSGVGIGGVWEAALRHVYGVLFPQVAAASQAPQ
jgi:hypothetical protein